MRLWSLHPSYLDTKGLVASWREALLAQKVLIGETKGYTKHPQLQRFRECKIESSTEYKPKYSDATIAVGAFLLEIYNEATKRGYQFDHSKILCVKELAENDRIPVKYGQVQYEFTWLLSKLKERDLKRYKEMENLKEGDKYVGLRVNPCFSIVPDDMNLETWEKISDAQKKSPTKSNTKRKRKIEKVEIEEEIEEQVEIDELGTEEIVVQVSKRITRSQTISLRSPPKKSKLV
jgi:hypothetical protein